MFFAKPGAAAAPGSNQVLYAADGYPGRIYRLSPWRAKYLERSAVPGTVLGSLAAFTNWHARENVLFAAELLNWRVQTLTLEIGQ